MLSQYKDMTIERNFYESCYVWCWKHWPWLYWRIILWNRLWSRFYRCKRWRDPSDQQRENLSSDYYERGTTCSLDQKYPCCGWKRLWSCQQWNRWRWYYGNCFRCCSPWESGSCHCPRTFKALGERIFEYSGYLNLWESDGCWCTVTRLFIKSSSRR